MPETNYEKYLIDKPIGEAGLKYQLNNRMHTSMTYLSSAQVPEAKYYIEFGWVWGIPEPNPYTSEHMHRYDEIVLHIGGDCNNPEDLGAEIEYYVGGQPLTFNTTTGLFVPRWLKHGPLTWKKYQKPYIQMTLMLGTGSIREGWVDSNSEEAGKELAKQKIGIDYEKYLVRKPTYEVVAGTPVKGRQGPASMTLMSNDLVSGCNIYVECGWIWDMPDPNPHIFEHTHDFEEIVLHIGSDYKNPEDLGAEIEFYLGGQPLKVDRTSSIFVPKGVKHGPLIWKRVSGPHLEMAIMPGAGTLVEADPGGHRKKMARRNNKNG